MAELERNRELAALAKIGEEIFEALELIAVFLRQADGRLDTFLPATEQEKAFLRRKNEIAFFPLVVFEDAEVFEELADIQGFGAGNGNVVSSPWIRGDFVFAPTGVAAGLSIHFEQNKIGEASFAEAPGGAEAGNAAANNNDGKLFDAFGGRKSGAVTQEVAHLEGVVDETPLDAAVGFEGESDERRAAELQKSAAAKLQCVMSFQSLS